MDLRQELIEALASECASFFPCPTCSSVEIVDFILAQPAMVVGADVIVAAQDWVEHVVVPSNAPVSRSRRLVEAVSAYNGMRS